jgi:hypothetical protein
MEKSREETPIVKRFMCAVQWELGHQAVPFEVHGIKPDGRVAWAALCQFLLSKANTKGPHQRVALGCLIKGQRLKAEYVSKGHYRFRPGAENPTYTVRIMEL